MYVLAQNLRFEWLAAAMEQLDFSLQAVRSCTFPSRPEPKSATWHAPNGQAWARYLYVPDLEVRCVWQVAALEDAELPAHFDLERALEHMLGEPPFERWSQLRDQLEDKTWSVTQRAAAAWRVRGQFALDASERELCAETLGAALERGAVFTRRAITAQLFFWSHPHLRSALERARDDEDLEVRLHAREALEQLDSRELLF